MTLSAQSLASFAHREGRESFSDEESMKNRDDMAEKDSRPFPRAACAIQASRAGVAPWPNLLQNMCETGWLDEGIRDTLSVAGLAIL